MEQISHTFYLHQAKHNEITKTLFQTYITSTDTDVILICDDDQQIPAHKNVIAAASPFFEVYSLYQKISKKSL